MNDLSPAATRWLADHHGVISAARLRACGVGRSTTLRLVRRGVLTAAHKGVFVLAATNPTLQQRCVVLSLAHPSGFVSGPTAGSLLDLRRMPRTSALHFAVRHGLHLPAEHGVCFRQSTKLPSSHRAVGDDGIAIAKPARLSFDLAADLQPLDHLSVVQQLLHTNRVTVYELIAMGDLLCHPARDGSHLFRETLHRLGADGPAQSHPEVVLAEALRARGVPVERQARVLRAAGGSAVHVDLAVPDVKWGVDLDIHPEHRAFEGHAGDTRRYRGLHLVDWQVEPVSEADMADVESLAAELCSLYHARCRQVRSIRVFPEGHVGRKHSDGRKHSG